MLTRGHARRAGRPNPNPNPNPNPSPNPNPEPNPDPDPNPNPNPNLNQARGEAAASGAIDPPQTERRAGVPSRPWDHSYMWRLRRAETLRAEDAAFCSALRDQCTGSCRLLVTLTRTRTRTRTLSLTLALTLTPTLTLTLGRVLISTAGCAAASCDAAGRGSPRHDPSGDHSPRAAHPSLLWPEAMRQEPRAGGSPNFNPNSNPNPNPNPNLTLTLPLARTLAPTLGGSPYRCAPLPTSCRRLRQLVLLRVRLLVPRPRPWY